MMSFKILLHKYLASCSLLLIFLTSFTIYREEDIFWDVHVQRLLFQGTALSLSTLCLVFDVCVKKITVKINRLDLFVVVFLLCNIFSRFWLIKNYSHDHET